MSVQALISPSASVIMSGLYRRSGEKKCYRSERARGCVAAPVSVGLNRSAARCPCEFFAKIRANFSQQDSYRPI